MLRNLLALKI
jgi:hypothetical protein